MTAQPELDPKNPHMNVRDNVNMDPNGAGQDHRMALYNSAYDINASGTGYKSDCFPKDFPRNFPKDFPNTGDGKDFEIPHCWPLPNGGDWDHRLNPDSVKPSDQQENKAETKLDSGINGLIPDADKQNLKDANHALLTGDSAGLAAVYEKYKDDPEKLKAFLQEQNHELKDANSEVGVKLTDDGKIYVSKDQGHTAVEIDPATGQTAVRKVMHGPDGEIYIGDKVDNADPNKTLDRIGNHAVNEINEPEFQTGWGLHHEHLKGHFRHSYLTTMQYQIDPNAGADANAMPADQNVVTTNAPQATYV